MVTRTCPPPTPFQELTPGDLVVYQTRGMPDERQGRVREVYVGHVTLVDTPRCVTADAYLRKLPDGHNHDTKEDDMGTRPYADWTGDMRAELVRRVNDLREEGVSADKAITQSIVEMAYRGTDIPTSKTYSNWKYCMACNAANEPALGAAGAPTLAEARDGLEHERDIVDDTGLAQELDSEDSIGYAALLTTLQMASGHSVKHAARIVAANLGDGVTEQQIMNHLESMETKVATAPRRGDPGRALARWAVAIDALDGLPAAEILERWEMSLDALEGR